MEIIRDPEIQITCQVLQEWLKEKPMLLLLDVRENWELDICKMPGAVHIPLGNLPTRFEELPKDRSIVVFCHHGMRSLKGAAFLRAQGLSQAVSLSGGIDKWAREVDSSLKTY
ncbi:MAG: rhodanese-like domain-containing protein [Dongiaceae bacterium]